MIGPTPRQGRPLLVELLTAVKLALVTEASLRAVLAPLGRTTRIRDSCWWAWVPLSLGVWVNIGHWTSFGDVARVFGSAR